MKVIISHDVDHLTVREHLSDLIIPKMVARSALELTKGFIGTLEYLNRMVSLFGNQWQHQEELMEYNARKGIPATFFFGMSNGKGLKYSVDQAKPFINYVLESGFDAGVHGIAYQNPQQIRNEYEKFAAVSGLKQFGIRMHYLRQQPDTLPMLEQAGYLFDTTIYELKNPYRVGTLWEFPLHLMDGYEIEAGKSWQSRNQERIRQSTRDRIRQAQEAGINYLTVLFHDRYFHKSFSAWMNWYCWVIEYLCEMNSTFISYRQAVEELNEES